MHVSVAREVRLIVDMFTFCFLCVSTEGCSVYMRRKISKRAAAAHVLPLGTLVSHLKKALVVLTWKCSALKFLENTLYRTTSLGTVESTSI